eukprot:scaffold3980_cov61-Phaeocystis_antarctica.AAC.3
MQQQQAGSTFSASAAPPRCNLARICRLASSPPRTASASWHGGGACTLLEAGVGALPPSPSPTTVTCCIHSAAHASSSKATQRAAVAAAHGPSALLNVPAGHQPTAPHSSPWLFCPRQTTASSSPSPLAAAAGGNSTAHQSCTGASCKIGAPSTPTLETQSRPTCLARASPVASTSGTVASVHEGAPELAAQARSSHSSSGALQQGGSSMLRSSEIS